MATATPIATGLPGPQITQGAVNNQPVPFRRATSERADQVVFDTLTQTTARQQLERQIEGSGYIFGLALRIVATTAANAATVAFTEDAPWSSLDSVVIRDANGEIANLQGYDLYLANLIGRQYVNRFQDASTSTYLFNSVSGVGGGLGGSFAFFARVPIGLNRRSLRGILGNQDRAQKYQLRTDLAASTAVYTTPPTTLPSIAVERYYENYSVPSPMSPIGAPQQVIPSDYGTVHFTTAVTAEAAPTASSKINHFLKRIGNTIRWIALVFRAGNGATPRATAEATPPTNIRVKLGEDAVFNETYFYRRALMFERYGFDLPSGVLVYDAIHDFEAGAGFEFGDDYWHTQALVNAQFEITYSAAFTVGSTLRIITDDLIYVPPIVGNQVSPGGTR